MSSRSKFAVNLGGGGGGGGNVPCIPYPWIRPCTVTHLHTVCCTHLGLILSLGDVVWGFTFASANLNLDKKKPETVPDVVSRGCSAERVVGG